MQHFKKNILTYVLVPLILLTTAASYYRFVVLHDHMVSYEGFCDPETESCFVGCEDETVPDFSECSDDELFYFTEVERYAPDLITLCGDDITDCEAADFCSESETDCSVTYCDPVLDEGFCNESTEVMNPQEFEIQLHAPADQPQETGDNSIIHSL